MVHWRPFTRTFCRLNTCWWLSSHLVLLIESRKCFLAEYVPLALWHATFPYVLSPLSTLWRRCRMEKFWDASHTHRDQCSARALWIEWCCYRPCTAQNVWWAGILRNFLQTPQFEFGKFISSQLLSAQLTVNPQSYGVASWCCGNCIIHAVMFRSFVGELIRRVSNCSDWVTYNHLVCFCSFSWFPLGSCPYSSCSQKSCCNCSQFRPCHHKLLSFISLAEIPLVSKSAGLEYPVQ